VNGSCRISVATSSVMVGERYCRKPSVVRRRRRAPAANITSGSAVSGPVNIKRPSRVGEAEGKAPVPSSAQSAINTAATGNSRTVSTVRPSSESTGVIFRT